MIQVTKMQFLSPEWIIGNFVMIDMFVFRTRCTRCYCTPKSSKMSSNEGRQMNQVPICDCVIFIFPQKNLSSLNV